MKMTMMTTSSRAKAEDQANANAGPDRDGLGLLLSAMAAREGSGIAKLQASSAAAASAAPSPTTGQFFGRGVPVILAGILSNPAYAPIVAWLPRGDAFVVLDPERFRREILPRHFRRVTDFRSFRRKLNRYGFRTMRRATVAAALGDLTVGVGASAFEHDHFRRGRPDLLAKVKCQSKPTSSEKAERGVSAVERTVCSPSNSDADAVVVQDISRAPSPRSAAERVSSLANPAITQPLSNAHVPHSAMERVVISPIAGNANATIDQAIPSPRASFLSGVSPNAQIVGHKQLSPACLPRRAYPSTIIAQAIATAATPDSSGISDGAKSIDEIEHRILMLEIWRRVSKGLMQLPPASELAVPPGCEGVTYMRNH